MYHVYVCTAAYQVPGTGTYFLDLFPGAEGANNHFNLYIRPASSRWFENLQSKTGAALGKNTTRPRHG